MHRVATTAFFRQVPTQEAAAQRLSLSLSTYRRHLTRAVEHVCEQLWKLELYGTDAVSAGSSDSDGMAVNEVNSPFSLQGAVALVTGANRGIGRTFAAELLERGAARVYAGARNPAVIDNPALFPVRLDITDPGQVAAAAERCPDVTVLINNAGVFSALPLLGAPSIEIVRADMETNFFGSLAMMRAFACETSWPGGVPGWSPCTPRSSRPI
jgi:hypothetical protein